MIVKYLASDSVRVFVSAIDNELQRDEHIFTLFPVSRYTKIVIPRLEKLTFWAENFPKLLAVIAYIAHKIWAPLYLFVLLLQTICAVFNVSKKSAIKGKEIFFVNSLVSIICSKNTDYCGKFLYSTKALEKAGPVGESLGCIQDCASLSDIRSAFVNSVRSLFLVWGESRIQGDIFQVYPAFQWFLAWNVLAKGDGGLTSIWMSSESDRWAVLLDQLPINVERIIVQHGLLNDPAGQNGFRNSAPLPTLLKNISKIILLDKESEPWFRNRVLAKESFTQFEFSEEWKLPQQAFPDVIPSLLIIGQRECSKEECKLANYLVVAAPNARIYLKPPPSASIRQYERLLSKHVILIKDPFFFPVFTLCICNHYSTLAFLYAKRSTKVVYTNEIRDETLEYVHHLILKTLLSESANTVPNSSTKGHASL